MRQLLGSDFGSERTFARYFRTRRIFAEMRAAGYECDENEALRLSTRANGTLNISRLERIVEAQLIFAVLKDGDS
jgi:hypothetical protein